MDRTGSERQQRRIGLLKEGGVTQTTVLVHEDCKEALKALRPLLLDGSVGPSLAQLAKSMNESVHFTNVAQVRQLSPFRYPGGKTWLVPHTRTWLRSIDPQPKILLEPFAGGGMVGLSAAAEGLVDKVEMWELDAEVSAVWKVIFGESDADVTALAQKIVDFEVTAENVREVIDGDDKDTRAMAFRTIVKNRVQRGGIMAPGAGLVKNGENGRGLSSRWYPETLAKRIDALRLLKDRINFVEGDAFDAIAKHADDAGCAMFIDPPYTAAGKRAGSRLYKHNDLDHENLFQVVKNSAGPALLTYDNTTEVRTLADQHGFLTATVPMKNSHHALMREMMIFKS